MILTLVLALARPVLLEQAFELGRPSEAVAVLDAACEACAWGTKGREAAVLVLSVDGRYSQHVVLSRGPAAYRVALGPLPAGIHRLSVALDRKATAQGAGRISVSHVEITVIPENNAEHAALAHAPILHLRPGAIERFTDMPLVLWSETETTPRGTRIRYSVVFSNEDGGTPPDRLMATWGRVSDIEYVYGVELDAGGRVLAEEYQGKEHKITPFRGRREGQHPVLFVVTDNNMLSDRGRARVRVALAPVAFDLTGVSREAVMDAHPWTYRVSNQEARREGRVAKDSGSSGSIPDPRRFVYLEACAEMRDAALAFALGIAGPDGTTEWRESDGGQVKFRITRNPDHFPNGCFRGAVALPEGTTTAQLRALRFRSFPRPTRESEPPSTGAARLLRVNRVFLLREDDTPGPNLFTWLGDAPLMPMGSPVELPAQPEPR